MSMTDDVKHTRKSIKKVLEEIELAIIEAHMEATKIGIDVYSMRTSDGNWVMNKLICAKAQALHSLLLVGQHGS